MLVNFRQTSRSSVAAPPRPPAHCAGWVDRDQQHAAAANHPHVVPLDRVERAERLAEAEAGDDERDTQPDAVRDAEHGASSGRGGRRGKRLDDSERRPDARSPAEAEHDAQQRGAGDPECGQAVEPPLPLEPGQQAHEGKAHHDCNPAADPVEQDLVPFEMRAGVAEERAEEHKDR
jgi:hypothetical protein